MTGYVYLDDPGDNQYFTVDASEGHHFVVLGWSLVDDEMEGLYLSSQEARALATHLNVYAGRVENK